MKTTLICILALILSKEVCSQSIIRYKSPQGKVYTQAEVDSLLTAKNLKLKENDMNMKMEIVDKENVGDTLFYKYKLNITNKAIDKNDSTKNEFLNIALPDFSYRDMKGKKVNLTSLKGKPIILNFWFTTCGPCIAEMPELNRLKEKYKATDIVFLSMTYETKSKVQSFLKKRKFDFQIIPNVKEYCDKFTNNYPINIFIDRNGIIKNIQNGMPQIYDSKTKTISDKVNSKEFEDALLQIK